MIYIFWSSKTEKEAERVILKLLEKRWIACASLVPSVRSFYRWKGAIEKAEEVKVLLKTLPKHFDAICECIRTEGSYEVPEIVQMEASRVYLPYLSWVEESVEK